MISSTSHELQKKFVLPIEFSDCARINRDEKGNAIGKKELWYVKPLEILVYQAFGLINTVQ